MAVSPTVQEFLRRSDVEYTVYPHSRAYTATDEAAETSVPERNWAKVVVCFADREPVQVVVPADRNVDLPEVARLTGAKQVRLATEDELDWLYPDCEPGAMPPFGPLFHQIMLVDDLLASDEFIAFNAGTFGDAIAMRFVDFDALTHPVVGRLSRLRA